MARDHTRVNVALWSDPDFRALPPAAQHLYLTLWTSPGRTYCGTHDWRPNRLVKLSVGFTVEHLRVVAECLAARYFVVVDDETEEILIRSWARFDGLMKQPRMAVSYASAYAEVASPSLRQVLAHETEKMHKIWPSLECWSDPRVAGILDHPALSAKELDTPADPFRDAFGHSLALGLPPVSSAFGPNASQGLPPVSTPPTTATATATKPTVVEGGVGGEVSKRTGKPARQLPKDWQPNDGHQTFAASKGLDVDDERAQFTDHHRAKGSTMKDWDAAFRTWLRNSAKWSPIAARPTVKREPHVLPHASELEAPPDGLSDEEYVRWAYDQAAKRKAGHA